MKRRIIVAGMGVALALGGCGAPVERAASDEARQDGGWTAVPRIRAVERQGAGLIVRGDASPGARVVLRGDQDQAFAAGADAAGHFELLVGAVPAAMLLTPEVQVGQFPGAGPEQLVLAGDDAPLAALLTDGGASRRLSVGPALDSVDGDGRGLLAAGRAAPGARVSVSAEGGATVDVVADAGGRWIAALPGVGDRAATITVGAAAFAYPGPAPSEELGRIQRAGDGWRLARPLSSTARQTTWFPDA